MIWGAFYEYGIIKVEGETLVEILRYQFLSIVLFLESFEAIFRHRKPGYIAWRDGQADASTCRHQRYAYVCQI
jgi:hypothetical protein